MIYNQELETLPLEKLKTLQSERLKKLVEYTKANSAFYQKKYQAHGINPADIKSIDDIQKLPFTTKDDMRDNYPWGVFSAPIAETAEIHVSSGTSGNPTLMGYSKSDLDLWAEVMARSLVCAGVKKGDMVQVAYGYGLFTGGFGAHYGALKLGATIMPMGSGQTRRQILLMQSLRPTVLACTPSYALYMAEEAAAMDIGPDELSWQIGVFGAEPWSEAMRKEIEKRLGMQAHDIYGLSEIIGPGVAMGCAEQNGLHLWSDVFYPEVLDPQTNLPVPDGADGELVITTLTKTAAPLIRYRTRDIVSITHEPCACGRTAPRISKIKGRVDDMIIVRGINIFPSQVEHVLLNVGKGVSPNYQIVVDRNAHYQDSIEIMVELEEGIFSDSMSEIAELERTILKEMAAVLTISPKLRFVSPGTIARSEGKAKRIIDKRSI